MNKKKFLKAISDGDYEKTCQIIDNGGFEDAYGHAVMVCFLSDSSEKMIDKMISLIDGDGDSYLEYAFDSNNEMAIRKLLPMLDRLDSINKVLHWACWKGKSDLILGVIQKDKHDNLEYYGAMKAAVSWGKSEIVDLLFDKSYPHKEKVKHFLEIHNIKNKTQEYFLAKCEAYESKKDMMDKVSCGMGEKRKRKI